jgi:uncharacterized repeat protein (TIGR03803 family)
VPNHKFPLSRRTVLPIVAALLFTAHTFAATHKLLHSFNPGGADGADPYAGLIADAADNLYGTTTQGGPDNAGTVFQLSPNGDGSWTEKVLHSFNFNYVDGRRPYASLILDAAGNLYGTTIYGGIRDAGTVFELSPNGDGSWTEKVLHSFGDENDGWAPQAALVLDSNGNLYGTTQYGGIHFCNGASCGTVFELSPREDGGWSEKVLHSFGNGSDGAGPVGSLIFDGAGNLYGTTSGGGIHNGCSGGCGTVFELTPREGGSWSETILHNFGHRDGTVPQAGLIFDATGNLYSTTSQGGIYDGGTVFSMQPRQGGGWTVTVLYNFNQEQNGGGPVGTLVMDRAGNLYGATSYGGSFYDYGAVFELKRRQGGGWTEAVLHSFGAPSDGSMPQAGLIIDAAGNLYGTTMVGGTYNWGAVFSLTPGQDGSWTESVLYSFNNRGRDGSLPGSGLLFDPAGNLYGTTIAGGIHTGCYYFAGCGVVYKLTPEQDGGWAKRVIHSFGNGNDGQTPSSGLIMDAAGNLYGATEYGGSNLGGAVYELIPQQDGSYTESVLHSFGDYSDGQYPGGSLVFDAAGKLYGTTSMGGIHETCQLESTCGTVFQLSPRPGGGWSETVLHSFGGGEDGSIPGAGLTLDASGNLYGTTSQGGLHDGGTVFELSPRQGGGWLETVLHSFNGDDGGAPASELIFDAAGNLYGTTLQGGIHDSGTVFELSPRQGGGWTETVLHSFGKGTDGSRPAGGLVFDNAGNLYGATQSGGVYTYTGTVFKLSPSADG